MSRFKLKMILYFMTVLVVLIIGIIAFLANLPKIFDKSNILRYETVIFSTNLQLNETVCRNYDINSNFDFISEIRRINNLSESDGMLGKALLVPVLISN